MSSLPPAARIFLTILWGSAAAAAGLVLFNSTGLAERLPLLLLWLILFTLSDYFEVRIEAGDGNSALMTVTDAAMVFLTAIEGPRGLPVVLLGTLLIGAIQRQAWFRNLFNVASRGIIYSLMLLAYSMLQPPGMLPYSGAQGLATFVAVAVIDYFGGILFVATIIALARQQPLLHVYRESFRQVSWVYLITMPVGAVLAALWVSSPWLVVLGVIPLIMAQRSYQALAAWQVESRRSQALAAEQTHLVAELREKQDELVRSSKLAALGTFSAGIAHEFNNLLAGILGHAELGLLSDNPAEKDESLQVAVNTCLRGRSITKGLLTFARRSDPQRSLSQIREVVDETLQLVERELAKQNIRIERRFSPVPPTVCDQGQIAQVLLNLVTNARDAMAGMGGGSIVVGLEQQGDQIELAVADTGCGIAPELIDQIFQPFVTTKGALGGSTTPGTGLGLAISYGIVQSHGGSISIQSKVGHGTTLFVRLPIVGEHPGSLGSAPTERADAALRVLVIDDEPLVTEAITRLLASHGHTLVAAHNWQSALALYQAASYDLVISDVVMPGMNGAELFEQLRAIDPDVRVIAMTGQPGTAYADQMLAAGACGIVYKPFEIEQLLRAMREAVRALAVAG